MSDGCISSFGSYGILLGDNKAEHLKILYLIYPVLVEMLQKNLLSKWISQLHNDLQHTAEKFLGTSFVLGLYEKLWCVCFGILLDTVLLLCVIFKNPKY